MHKILFFACFFIAFSIQSSAQLNGTYKDGTDSLSFSNENVIFSVSGFSGLSTVQVGEGKYEVVEDFLLIETGDYSGEKTTFQALEKSKRDTTTVKVVSKQNYPVQGMLIEWLNQSGKVIKGQVSGDDGKVLFIPDPKTRQIRVSQLGFHNIVFDFDTSKDFLIQAAKNDVIEHKTVVFRLNQVDDETLSVLLLSDDFNPGKNRDKELEKLQKRAKKNNKLDKRLKKVYVPIYSR